MTRKEFAKELGQRIREVREKKGISLKAFESKEGAIDKSELSRIENGEMVPNSFTLHKIATVFNVSIKEFF